MLGGEIYYRAIGRPWGPAADLIVKFHPLRHCCRHWQAARAVRERLEPLAHSSSSQAGREYFRRSTIRGPPAAVRLSDRLTRTVCDWVSAPGLPVRAAFNEKVS